MRILVFLLHTKFISSLIFNSPWTKLRSSHPEVLLEESVLKMCSKFTGEHPCQNVILVKLLCNVIEIALRHGCSPVNLLHIFRTPFPMNTPGWLLQFILALKIRIHNALFQRCIQTPIKLLKLSYLLKYSTGSSR